MSAPIPRKPRSWAKRTIEDDPFVQHKIFVPKSISAKVEAVSLLKDIPVSRLFVIATDNEIDNNNFELDLTMPDVPFRENAYAEQAVKIFEYLRRFPTGTGLDTLWLARRDIGIVGKHEFLLGYRELLMSKMVEEYYPNRSKFRYRKDYRYVKCVGVKPNVKYRKPTDISAEE